MGDVLSLNQAIDRLAPLRGRSRIVTTNGVFDILHVGHLRYLQGCKQPGETLVVLVNTDASVKRLKGPQRPIVGQADRMELLAGLGCVDIVVPFDEDTPVALLERLKPDVHVKGAQYTVDTLPEAETLKKLGTEIRFAPMVANKSTSGVIETIQERLQAESSPEPGRKVGWP